MCTESPHGAHGRLCEDCLGDRISKIAEMATRDRAPLPLWVRQRGFRVRLAAVEMRRSSVTLTA
jgi:hypothetical protein